MSAVTIDAEAARQLLGQNKMIELRDPEGNFLGHFLPREPLVPWAPEITAEQLTRERKARPGKPLSEIIKRLTGQ